MTIAGEVFAESCTHTVAFISNQRDGKQISGGFVFKDNSVLRIDINGVVAYCASDFANYMGVK